MTRLTRSGRTLALEPLISAYRSADGDPITERILDAATEVLAASGLRRCSVEEIAEQSGLGRTTIYRRFDGRDEIIHAVLAREMRRVLTSVAAEVEHLDRIEDQVVEAFLCGLRAAEGSLLTTLVRREPQLLALATIEGGPAIATAREFLVQAYARRTGAPPGPVTAHVAEVLIRLALSLVLCPDTSFPRHDRQALHRLLDPLVGLR